LEAIMHHRGLVTLAASALAASAVAPSASAEDSASGNDRGSLDAAIQSFLTLPGTKSYLLEVGQNGASGRIAHWPNIPLFVASAYKTFVLGQYLRDVEAGRLAEDEALTLDDSVRSPGSPVFLDLTGRIAARSVLEAMIAYSDNTATDLATLQVGADRVRALISEAGLQSTRIPDSTRIFASYLFGAPPGTDLGWAGVQRAMMNPPGQIRPPLNDQQTLASTARDLVSWYEQVLAGAFFTRPETLREFRRIQAMADQIPLAVPPDTPAYAKGGKVNNLDGFNAKSFAGQMVVGRTPVTFCFLVNWTSTRDDFAEVEAAYFAAIADILSVVKQALR
jgi:beta-lactamase class A